MYGVKLQISGHLGQIPNAGTKLYSWKICI